jgi:pimeloyl-ACP methyl ester carboxylesterase
MSKHEKSNRSSRLIFVMATCLMIVGCSEAPSAEDRVVSLLAEDAPYHLVAEELFETLGWDLPDDGAAVTKLANNAPGGALDPRDLESVAATELGYTARWHEIRFNTYGLDWDISGLQLTPENALPGLPTMVIINGGAANWYEFFISPKNEPGLAQYLAQRVPVLLLSIPGNYRHGGWSESDFGERIPGYLLDRDVSVEEAKVRNAVYTFRVVTDGVMAILDRLIPGPVVVIGHSTGGEVQYILKEALAEKNRGLSMGWGTGGPAGLRSMRSFRSDRSIDDYQHVTTLRARTSDQYSRGYLGPLNPFWDPSLPRTEVAAAWMGSEARRRAQFKQPLQDMEHSSSINLLPEISTQIREALAENPYGVEAEEVIDDLFSTMRAPVGGYKKMIWTTTNLDTGHWNEDPSKARELLVAQEFREANPDIPIRVLVFDVPMTHYGHIEKPRELAGGLVAALRWLTAP